jgi:hypothetical protein
MIESISKMLLPADRGAARGSPPVHVVFLPSDRYRDVSIKPVKQGSNQNSRTGIGVLMVNEIQ